MMHVLIVSAERDYAQYGDSTHAGGIHGMSLLKSGLNSERSPKQWTLLLIIRVLALQEELRHGQAWKHSWSMKQWDSQNTLRQYHQWKFDVRKTATSLDKMTGMVRCLELVVGGCTV